MSDSELGSRLRKAVGSGDLKAVHRLIKGGIDVNARYWYSSTLLHEAVGLGSMEMVRILLQASADVNATNDDLRTPLHIAARSGSLEIAQELINHGSLLDSRTTDGKTCLHVALWRGNNNVARLLIDRGASVNIADNDGWTPLYWACRLNYLDSVQLLVSHGAKLNHQVKNGWTPLHVALNYGHVDIARFLIVEGIDVNICASKDSLPGLLAHNGAMSKATTLSLLETLKVAGYSPHHDACLRIPKHTSTGAPLKTYKDLIPGNETISDWVENQAGQISSLACLCRNRIRHRIRYCQLGRSIRQPLLSLPLPNVLLEFLTLGEIQESFG